MYQNVGFTGYTWIRRSLSLVMVAVLGVLLAACSSAAATPTAAPTATTRPIDTATPAAGATPTVGATPTSVPASGQQPFQLLITKPEDQSVVSANPLPLSGRTGTDAVVSVNGANVPVDSSGVFSTDVTLEEGPNVIEVVATDTGGRVLSSIIAVIFRP